jgi:plasmid stabilization system protein ParE
MTKPKRYKVKATPYFKLSVQRLSAFLSKKYSVQQAATNNKALLEKINQTLPEQPRIAPVSARLLALGISNFRQWAIDEHNIIFYRIDDKKAEVTLLLAMDARQDIQKLLYELILLK